MVIGYHAVICVCEREREEMEKNEKRCQGVETKLYFKRVNLLKNLDHNDYKKI